MFKNLLIALLISITISVVAQTETTCLHQVDSFYNGNSSAYTIEGTITIEEDNTTGDLFVVFKDDVVISSGPALAVVFGKENTSYRKQDTYFVMDTVLTSYTGPQTFPLPSSFDITKYSFLGIECIDFPDAYWGGGPIEECKDTGVASKFIQKEVEGISIFPQPASDYMNIKIDNADVTGYKIYTIAGKEVSSFDRSVNQIYILDFEPGIYQVIFDLKGGKRHAKKIVIQ